MLAWVWQQEQVEAAALSLPGQPAKQERVSEPDAGLEERGCCGDTSSTFLSFVSL